MTHHTDKAAPTAPPVTAVKAPRRYLRLRQVTRRCWYDYLWPSLEPPTAEEAGEDVHRLKLRKDRDLARIDEQGTDPGRLGSSLAKCLALFEAEHERQKSVDARLTTIVALTAALAGVSGLALNGFKWDGADHAEVYWALVALASVFTLYAVVQLLCGLLAAVRGLQRKAYPQPEVVDVLKPAIMDDTTFMRSCMKVYVECFHEHQQLNNEKMSQMAVAHQALKNFLVAVLALVVVLIAIRFVPDVAKPSGAVMIRAVGRTADLPPGAGRR